MTTQKRQEENLRKKIEKISQASKELITTTAFAEMDKDEDGKVTTEEFIAACMSQEEFSKMLALKIINIFIEDDNQTPQLSYTVHDCTLDQTVLTKGMKKKSIKGS